MSRYVDLNVAYWIWRAGVPEYTLEAAVRLEDGGGEKIGPREDEGGFIVET